MKYFEHIQEQLQDSDFSEAQKVAKEIYKFMCSLKISQQLKETHQVNASSHEIQEIILQKCEELGMVDEETELFSDYDTSQLRPDYYIPINQSGLIIEVERGKTIVSNMDLLDIWKCHICKKADYLLLIVPVVRQTTNGRQTKIYEYVLKRIGSFFTKNNSVNVKACFIIGYE